MECDIFADTDNYLSDDFHHRCEMQFVWTEEIEPKEANTTYLHLKE